MAKGPPWSELCICSCDGLFGKSFSPFFRMVFVLTSALLPNIKIGPSCFLLVPILVRSGSFCDHCIVLGSVVGIHLVDVGFVVACIGSHCWIHW